MLRFNLIIVLLILFIPANAQTNFQVEKSRTGLECS